MIVKILGGIDVISAVIFLALGLKMNLFYYFLFLFGVLLILKGFFIITGNLFSLFDFFAGIILILSIFYQFPILFLLIISCLLFAKGMASFI